MCFLDLLYNNITNTIHNKKKNDPPPADIYNMILPFPTFNEPPFSDGKVLGVFDGATVLPVGKPVGIFDGDNDGDLDGNNDGVFDGDNVGDSDGELLGVFDGATV